MKFDCSKEFDLQEIYRKLTSGHTAPTVPANNFFTHENELALLQKKMNKMMYARMKSQNSARRVN